MYDVNCWNRSISWLLLGVVCWQFELDFDGVVNYDYFGVKVYFLKIFQVEEIIVCGCVVDFIEEGEVVVDVFGCEFGCFEIYGLQCLLLLGSVFVVMFVFVEGQLIDFVEGFVFEMGWRVWYIKCEEWVYG